MKAMTNYKGYVLQRGTSPIDGKPFVVIMTMKTTNRKTGDMVQVWILGMTLIPWRLLPRVMTTQSAATVRTANKLTVHVPVTLM